MTPTSEKYTLEFEDFKITNEERKYFDADVTIITPDLDPIELEFDGDDEPDVDLPPERCELHGQCRLFQWQSFHRTRCDAHPTGSAGDDTLWRCAGDQSLFDDHV